MLDLALLKGRASLGGAEFHTSQHGARTIVQAIHRRLAFLSLVDMDFGLRDDAFVPFFGNPGGALLAPSRLARGQGMVFMFLVTEMVPGGQGYVGRFPPAGRYRPTHDPVTDMARMNLFIEAQVRRASTQYVRVHKRFGTRPEGAPPVYREN